MFADNLEQNGKRCLFWINDDKQKAASDINITLNKLRIELN